MGRRMVLKGFLKRLRMSHMKIWTIGGINSGFRLFFLALEDEDKPKKSDMTMNPDGNAPPAKVIMEKKNEDESRTEAIKESQKVDQRLGFVLKRVLSNASHAGNHMRFSNHNVPKGKGAMSKLKLMFRKVEMKKQGPLIGAKLKFMKAKGSNGVVEKPLNSVVS
ncbi:hypothetical protein RJT34_06289 [Clitoria ternatea]|uniref:Uncharacterized protein n=1 Tax=Clitoria ternatea TaxID=43366 RepID=A0AAN9K2D6_CLITE